MTRASAAYSRVYQTVQPHDDLVRSAIGNFQSTLQVLTTLVGLIAATRQPS